MITYPVVFYRLWCVVVCDLEKYPSRMRMKFKTHYGIIALREKNREGTLSFFNF